MGGTMALVHREILNASIQAMKLSGFWSFSSDSGILMKIINIIYTIAMTSLICIFMGTVVADIFANTDDLDIMINDGCFAAGVIIILFKLINFEIQEKQICSLIQRIYEPVDYLSNINDDGVSNLINENIFFERCTSRGFTVCTILLIISIVFLVPVEEGQLPIGAKYPFRSTDGLLHNVAFTLQVGGLVFTIIAILAMDTIVLGFCRWISFQFDILHSNFLHCGDNIVSRQKSKNLSMKTKIGIGIDQQGDNEGVLIEREIERFVPFDSENIDIDNLRFSARFKNCIKHHQRLIEIIETINAMFGSSMFAQLYASAVIICLSSYQVVLGSDGTGSFLKFSCYCGVIFSQLFMWSYFGNNLLYQSTFLAISQWFSGWERQGRGDVGNLLIITMIRSRRALKLKAKGFYTISMETFLMILRVSYSFFTLLRKMNDT